MDAETYLRNLAEAEPRRFKAEVVPPVPPSASAVDILVISGAADMRASVPLTWWTS